MTTIANTIASSASSVPSFESLLVKMQPRFRYYARQFNRCRRIDPADVVQELTGLALENYTSLVQRGKEVFYSPLVRFAIKRYKEGRRCTGSNTTDVLAEQTQILGRCEVHSLSGFDDTDSWYFMVDQRVNVADHVQFRVDYETWLSQQTARDQDIIKDLAAGETTGDVATKYGVSAGLISQYRKRYANSWTRFITDKRELA